MYTYPQRQAHFPRMLTQALASKMTCERAQLIVCVWAREPALATDNACGSLHIHVCAFREPQVWRQVL
eukprot:6187594-Pleurochrysis_carterae.AAC.3